MGFSMNGMNRFIDLSVGNFVLVNGEWDARHERQTHMHISYLHECAGREMYLRVQFQLLFKDS